MNGSGNIVKPQSSEGRIWTFATNLTQKYFTLAFHTHNKLIAGKTTIWKVYSFTYQAGISFF